MIFFDKLKIKCMRWIDGKGFTMPEPNPRTVCMYNYCKEIVNKTLDAPIWAYEDEIQGLMKKFPNIKREREDIAKIYMEALEGLYGKKQFN